MEKKLITCHFNQMVLPGRKYNSITRLIYTNLIYSNIKRRSSPFQSFDKSTIPHPQRPTALPRSHLPPPTIALPTLEYHDSDTETKSRDFLPTSTTQFSPPSSPPPSPSARCLPPPLPHRLLPPIAASAAPVVTDAAPVFADDAGDSLHRRLVPASVPLATTIGPAGPGFRWRHSPVADQWFSLPPVPLLHRSPVV